VTKKKTLFCANADFYQEFALKSFFLSFYPPFCLRDPTFLLHFPNPGCDWSEVGEEKLEGEARKLKREEKCFGEKLIDKHFPKES